MITVDEVQETLKGIKTGTAAGPDKCILSDVKDFTSQELAVIFSKWWGNEIPDAATMCRTSLLPKSIKEKDQVGNWRPVTIGNLLMRIYRRIWGRRLRKEIKLNNRQKGFVQVDGCFENFSILKKVIENQRKKKKAYQIFFLNLAKAFDTFSHESIKKALMRKGVPTEIMTGIMEMYNGATSGIYRSWREVHQEN